MDDLAFLAVIACDVVLACDAVSACDAAGVAAFNIWGATLHSALKLPVEKAHDRAAASATYKALKGEALEDYIKGVNCLQNP